MTVGLQVYTFSEATALGLSKFELGGKGFGLVEMTKLGLPVPPGIVITTGMCKEYFKAGRKFPEGFEAKVKEKVKVLEATSGKRFGDPKYPLLVSIRSGAPFSMPGMMDTILNLGINDKTVEDVARVFDDPRFAYDTYRRFLQLFGKIVMKVPGEEFEKIIDEEKAKAGVGSDVEMSAGSWKEVARRFKALIKERTGKEVPQDPMEQLFMAVAAVFDSWYNPRAAEYRKIYKISEELGTAVNIVVMVFGNMDDQSATGVAFTRNPSTGENKFYGEYLVKAQGEDVVAGIRTPQPIDTLQQYLPQAFAEFLEISSKLEGYFKDMQDIEFTIERGKLYMLQTRTGKRTAQAAVQIATDMVEEGLISKEEAIGRIDPAQFEQLLHKQIDPSYKGVPIAQGLAASPGAASGRAVFTVEEAVKARERGEAVILVRPETAPEDISGMVASEGVLTSRGGKTSHAAVVSRGMGKPCIAGAEEVKIDLEKETFTSRGQKVRKGDIITIDGGTGLVFVGSVPVVEPELTPSVNSLLSWADAIRRLKIRANADTPAMALAARKNGAQGIGLCRTERMFNAPARLPIVQAMIVADTKEERQVQLDKLEPLQKSDFEEILRAMEGLPVTIRLMDLPLHEFLPKFEELLPEVLQMRMTNPGSPELPAKERLLKRVTQLQEHNPMLGHRGVRVAMSYPEIYRMQVRAIFEAAAELVKKKVQVEPEIMIPQVAEAEEFRIARQIVDEVAAEVTAKEGVEVEYRVGTMVETPRAALTADKIAKYAQFFSFGTNDLTQATFAFSRDDVEGKFMPLYLSLKILPFNPFESLDPDGVARLMGIAVKDGRKANPELTIGICGEHGGDPKSIAIADSLGLDYVSCSPYRVPVARLAAAQATIQEKLQTRSSV
ncbi:MAG TPA: pyruvate, phosphate dikinase [Conexivisphaerales archaeon]|nr:pyruvate, phosphate dikinase [Conexivisphaerales archaeon]